MYRMNTIFRYSFVCTVKISSCNSLSLQMTCVRILELLPVVFEKNWQSVVATGNSGMSMVKVMDYEWLQHLMEWGKSSLKVIVVYWKKAVISLLKLLKGAFSDASSSLIRSIENLITSGELCR